MQALAKNFLCVADEVWLLDHQDTSGGKFFREYVKSVPPTLGFAPTTKQGVYAMTAEGEYLGGHFARHSKADTLAMLKQALAKWNEIVQKKGLKPKPIPGMASNRTWGKDGLPYSAGGDVGPKGALVLQVFSRDLPSTGEKAAGVAEYKNFWNENWIDFTAEELQGFVPKAQAKGTLPEPLIRKIGRECLIDNVRGQVSQWADAEIRKAVLSTEVVSAKEGVLTLRFHGEFVAEAGPRGYDCTLHGRGIFDSRAGRFRLFELVATGLRKGPTNNFRQPNEPASPQGVAFIIEGQSEKGVPAPGAAANLPATASTDQKLAGPGATVSAELLPAWDARLRTLVEQDLASGRRIRFTFKPLGRLCELARLDTNGVMSIQAEGSEVQVFWKDLSLEDRRGIAVARIREGKPVEDLGLAAFYQFATGARAAGEELLRTLDPAEAEKVRAPFKKASP